MNRFAEYLLQISNKDYDTLQKWIIKNTLYEANTEAAIHKFLDHLVNINDFHFLGILLVWMNKEKNNQFDELITQYHQHILLYIGQNNINIIPVMYINILVRLPVSNQEI